MTAKKSEREGRWVTIDLHVHSIHSGGDLDPRGILEAAQRRFLDAVAITDLENDACSARGAWEARDTARADPSWPVAVVGREISGGDHFHFLLYGCGEEDGAAALQTNRRGIAILAHPWTIRRNHWAKSCVADLLQAGLLEGIELFNASVLGLAEGGERVDRVLQEIWEEWIAPYQLAVTGGSDFHRRRNREIGAGRTYLKVYRRDEAGLLEALQARRCVAGLTAEGAIPFGGAGGASQILWGGEPWLGELRQFVQTTRHLLDCFSKKETKPFFKALLAGGHYQIAHDLLRKFF